MANTDLRYRRTERFLLEAFGEALEKRALDKITVTSLAAAADINKATFYLHYRDIYDLAEAYAHAIAEERVAAMDYLEYYFDDPKQFAVYLVGDFEASKQEAMLLGKNGLMHYYLEAFTDAIHARLHELRSVPDDKRSSMMTTFVLNGVLSLLPRYGDDLTTMIEVAGEAMAAIDEYGRAHFGAQTNGGPAPQRAVAAKCQPE